MLDLKQFEPSRVWQTPEIPIVVFDKIDQLEFHDHYEHYHEQYQFRYVVHRQDVGFYTPVVFDVGLYMYEDSADSRKVKNFMNMIAEPFVEGALFMNHTSQFIVDLLKGQEAGYNRKHILEGIREQVEGQNILWYSDWGIPPLTRQAQRVVIYDMEQTGSMLDPVNVLTNLPAWISAKLGGIADLDNIYRAEIVAGYTQSTI